MASSQSKLLTAFLRLIHKKGFLRKQLASGKLNLFSAPMPPSFVLRTCQVYKFQINGRNVFTLKPKNRSKTNREILYLHGGAYVQNFNIFHWKFLADLVVATNSTITAPDYPLAPAQTYKESFEMVMALYRQVLVKTTTQNLIIMGDSSGGGFALALAQKLREEAISQPSQLILLSPWLDITLSNPEINDIDPYDPFLERESLQQAGYLYAGDTNPDHYLLSPINGSLQGLGKISVFAGSKDILVADARKLNSLATALGRELTYFEYADMVHGWMFLNLPESKKVRQQIVNLIIHG